MQKHKNKWALITGGTSGIGLATAELLLEEGANVIITGRYKETLESTVKQLGEKAHGIVSSASVMQDIHELSKKVKVLTSRIDILFLNAGYGKFAPVEFVTEEHFDELFNLHVKGVFFTAQAILPLMSKPSVLLFNTSFVTSIGSQNFSIYSAAKSAVQSFIKTFAAECSTKGIRVNGISPGHIKTDIFNKTGLSKEDVEAAIEGITPTIPLQRFGEPREIAKAVSFLACDESSYIHGTELSVDGGISVIR